MKVKTQKLKNGTNDFTFISSKDMWLKKIISFIGDHGFLADSPLMVSMSIMKKDPDYFINGAVSITIRKTCDRCAEEFIMPINHNFELALYSSSGSEALNLKNEDVVIFFNNEIELVPIIQEQFFLSLPMQTLCKTDCKGLCQYCGKNLNTGKCSCKEKKSISPFLVLKNVKIQRRR